MREFAIQSRMIRFTLLLVVGVARSGDSAVPNTPRVIPRNELEAKGGADYKGEGLAVTPIETGARLHCVFQRLDGEATPDGLWLTSTVTNAVSDRFQVTAIEVGRKAGNAMFDLAYPESSISFPRVGEVSVCGQTVRLSHPGLTEEYSVSMDGVRQDFIVEQAPPSPTDGELVVKLAVTGAHVEPKTHSGVVLENSGRKIAYSRLRATDATGKELPARMEVSLVEEEATSFNSWIVVDKDVEEQSFLTPAPARAELAVVVNDADAVYPVRIDPTFSDANWVSMGGISGAGGVVNAAVVDGSGNLYIGGNFVAAGNTIANYIAQWNGTNWSPLGSGMNSNVSALALSGNTLYAGGSFTTAGGSAANCVAQWNGSNWSALGSGISGADTDLNGLSVYALAVSGSTLYAGGNFTAAGSDTNANSIAQWNGSNWSGLGSGISGDQYDTFVSALAVSGNTLYVGGGFTRAGGTGANCIAQWNGSSWSDVGFANGLSVSALAVSGGGTLYVGGSFTTVGGDRAANNIAQWNGSSWSALGSGISGDFYETVVSALSVSGNTLYVGGRFTTAGNDTNANNIAQWNGTNWSPLGSGIGGGFESASDGPTVYALAVSGNTLYAGGDFTSADGTGTESIAQWNGSGWSALSPGMNGAVVALAVSGNTIYAGGVFTTAGGGAANCIAQWNGSGWSALGSGISGVGIDGIGPIVRALAVSGNTLYVGGDFTTAGSDTNANSIAQWNGSGWSALGSGISGEYLGPTVYALAVLGNTLYVGGDFTMAGGYPATNIAQWNGSSWLPLGSGMGGEYGGDVAALAVSGSTLYAGGDFTTAGSDTNANCIAQWDGSNWSGLGSGMPGGLSYVGALAVSGSTLYAGGDFTTAGGSAANSIAQWNGSSWAALGSGMSMSGFVYDPVVYALAVSGGTLYAGGGFTAAGGSAANNIAQWNGSSWSALGSGMNRAVAALAVSGSTLYAGGGFTTAGTNASAYAAMADLPLSLAFNTTDATFGFMNGAFGFDVSGPSGSNVIIQASTDLQTWIPLQTNLLGSGLLYFSDSQSPTNRQRFYRAVSP
jgi:trimeric autotransporter adhesin